MVPTWDGIPRWCSGKVSTCQCRRHRRCGFDPWVRKVLWRRKWQPTPVFLPGKFHGQKNLVVYSPRGHKESDTTGQLSTHPLGTNKTIFLSGKNNRSSVISRKKTQLKLIQALKKKLLQGDHFELMTRKAPRFSQGREWTSRQFFPLKSDLLFFWEWLFLLFFLI